MEGNKTCQRCGHHAIKCRAISDVMNLGVCATCAELALARYKAVLGYPLNGETRKDLPGQITITMGVENDCT